MIQTAILRSSEYNFKWREEIAGTRYYALHDAQLEVLAAKEKYVFGCAGTGGGKTALAALAVFYKLQQFKERKPGEFWRCLIVSPSSKIFESSRLKWHLLETFSNTPLQGNWNDSKKVYEGKDFEIIIRTAENDYTRLTGGDYDFVVGDEAWAMSHNAEIFAEMRRRSNLKNAQILIVTTPNTDGWLLECYLDAQKGDKDYFFRQWTTQDNPIKSPAQHREFLDKERIKYGEQKFQRMYCGQFAQLSGLVYDVFSSPDDKEHYPVIEPLKRLPAMAVRTYGGIDWGWDDPFSALSIVETEDGILYVTDEIYGSYKEQKDIASELKAMKKKWSISSENQYYTGQGEFSYYYCDTSRPESVALMRSFGLPIMNRKVKDIKAGISIVDQLFRTKRIKIFSTCKNLITEAKLYRWEDNGEPTDRNNHMMDALRYCLSSVFYQRPIDILPPEVEEKMPEEEKKQEDISQVNKLGNPKTIKEIEIEKVKTLEEKQREWRNYLLNCEDD